MTASCAICCKLKPNFHRPPPGRLIRSTQPFERINMDFKGPLPTSSKNKYILTIVDEYSRFPFAYPCSDISTSTVIKCLCNLFTMVGMPSYIHTDRGNAFMLSDLWSFLFNHGIASSRSTPYNPQGNGQVERYNGIIWKSILLALESQKMSTSQYEQVLPDALHAIHTLLSTATNETPHERFFKFHRKASHGCAIPSWLTTPGKVYLKRSVRTKHDPLVDEVELLEANSHYAHVRFPDGRESTVSTRHLAPCSLPDSPQEDSAVVTPSLPGPFDRDDSNNFCDFEGFESPTSPMEKLTPDHVPVHNGYSPPSPASSPVPQLHHSTRADHPVDRLQLSI